MAQLTLTIRKKPLCVDGWDKRLEKAKAMMRNGNKTIAEGAKNRKA